MEEHDHDRQAADGEAPHVYMILLHHSIATHFQGS